MTIKLLTTLKAELSRWRKLRHFSQLALAYEANVSQRHISYLETGRSKPSREMLMRLCEAMHIPFRERNKLLLLAGFSTMYGESSLEEPKMRPVLDALDSMLAAHNPLPALVVDRFWNIIKQNKSSEAFFSLLFSTQDIQSIIQNESAANLALLTMHPQGLRQYIRNWEHVYPVFIKRLDQEASFSGDIAVKEKLASYLSLSGLVIQESLLPPRDLLPVVPLKLCIKGCELSLFSMISTIGTPQDITTDELRIESFYPTDDKTNAYFASLLASFAV